MEKEVQREIDKVLRSIGKVYEEQRRIREKIAATIGATAADASAGQSVTATGLIVAGDGLTGGGALPGTVTLDVGAGDGIDVAANSVAVDLKAGGGLQFDAGEIEVNLAHTDLSGVTEDQHHNKQHNITAAADHTVSGAQYSMVGCSSLNTLGLILATYDPGTNIRILRSHSDGGITLDHIHITNDINVGGTVDGVDLASLAGAQFLVLSASGDMANERILTPGDGLDGTDAGAGSTYTLAVDVTDFIDTTTGLTESSNNIQVNITANEGLEFDGVTGALEVDVTDFIDTSYGLTESSNNIQVNLEANEGLEFNSGQIRVDVTDFIDTAAGLTESTNNIQVNLGANEGLEFSAGAIIVDVTDFIDTAAGLTETGNDIQVNLGFGLEFNAGAIDVDQDMAPTWTGTHTFQADIQLDANLDFVGAQSITTTAGDLTIAPAGDIIVDPVGDEVLPNTNYDINLGSLPKKYLSIHAAELWVSTLVAQDTIATIGGRILVGPTTTLAADLSSATVNGANELSNGGFETAGGGGADIFANWGESAGDGSIVQDSTIYHWGSNSCKLVSGDSSDTGVYQDFSVTAGEDKEHLFWTRGDGTLAGKYWIYDVTNAADILAITSTGVTGTTWARVIYRYTVPALCTTVRVLYYCPTRSSNGILNPGFETAGGGGDDVFANWTEVKSDGTILQDSSTKQAGTYSCKLTAGSALGTYVVQAQTVVPGENRELRFYTRGDGTYEGRYSVYDFTNSAFIINWTATGVTGTTWTEVVDNYVVPATCVSARVYFLCPSTDTGAAWFDEVDDFSGHAHFDDAEHHDQVTISVEHNEMTTGDVAYMEASGKVEFYDITSTPSGGGPYTYYVWRDKDGTGANDWYAGDAMFNTGNVGDGFIDIYSVHGIKSTSEYGPTVVVNGRDSVVYNDWTPIAAIGQLNGVYGYSSSAYGIGLGKYSEADYITIDTSNGVRFLDSSDVVQGQLSSSVWTLGEVGAAKSNIQITAGALQWRTNVTVNAELTTAGELILGDDDAAQDWISVSSGNGLRMYGNNALRVQVTTGGNVALGNVGGYPRMDYDGTDLYVRGSANEYIWVDADVGVRIYGGGSETFKVTTSGTMQLGVVGGYPRIDYDGTDLYIYGVDATDYIMMDADAGVKIITNSLLKFHADLSGNIYLYGDTNDYMTLGSGGIEIFSNAVKVVDIDNTGDFVFGDVATDKANIFFDQSEGQLNFRGGTNGTETSVRIDIDGGLVIDSYAGAGTARQNSISWENSAVYCEVGAYHGGANHSIEVTAKSIAAHTAGAVMSSVAPSTYAAQTAISSTSGSTLTHIELTTDTSPATDQIEMQTALAYITNATNTDGELRVRGGLRVGSTASGPAVGELWTSGDVRVGAGLYVGAIGTDPVADWIYADGGMYINDTENTDQTIGATINQGGYNDHALAVKSSDVGHTATNEAEGDTYFYIEKAEAASGGAALCGLKDSGGVAGFALSLQGVLDETAADTTKSTSAYGVVDIQANLESSNSRAACGSNENLLIIRNYTSTEFIFDAEGEGHSNVQWTTFGKHDDLALLDTLEKTVVTSEFGGWVEENKALLERLNIAHFDDEPGHAMINWSRLSMLLVGAIRQIAPRLERLETALLEG